VPDVLAAAFLERLQRGIVIAGHPEGLVQVDGFVLNGSAVLVLQAVLDHVKLERANTADDLGVINRTGEELDPAELLGAEARDALEVQQLSFRQRVPNLEVTGVVEADNVARKGLIHHLFFCGHEAGWVSELHLSPLANVQVVRISLEGTGADAQEGDPVAVARVHIGVNLENEAGELVFVR